MVLTYGDPSFYCKVGFGVVTEKIVPAPLTLTMHYHPIGLQKWPKRA
jgi:hypothetical protein